mmetsp:Transcript_19407/g.77288  ORF Transcript_19407/g.77288 Transcript_19407/m.77288 type:complete len:507 (+) Transcript_19407:146-1666(+)
MCDRDVTCSKRRSRSGRVAADGGQEDRRAPVMETRCTRPKAERDDAGGGPVTPKGAALARGDEEFCGQLSRAATVEASRVGRAVAAPRACLSDRERGPSAGHGARGDVRRLEERPSAPRERRPKTSSASAALERQHQRRDASAPSRWGSGVSEESTASPSAQLDDPHRLASAARGLRRAGVGELELRGGGERRVGLAEEVVARRGRRRCTTLAEGFRRGDVGRRDVVFGARAGHPRRDDLARGRLDLDRDGLEAGGREHGAHLVVGRGPRDSAREGLLGLELVGDLRRAQHVRDGDATARLEDAVHLAIHLRLVEREVDDAVRDDAVGDAVAERQVLDLAEAERDDLGRDGIFGRGEDAARLLEHLGRHVDADDAARRADLRGRREAVDARARAEVDDDLAALEVGDRERVPAPEPEVGALGELVELAFGVPQELAPLLDVAAVERQNRRPALGRRRVRAPHGVARVVLGDCRDRLGGGSARRRRRLFFRRAARRGRFFFRRATRG